MSTSYNEIDLPEFLEFKNIKTNKDMLPEILEFYNSNKNKFNKNNNNNNWRKHELKQGDNWIIANKFKQTDDEKIASQFTSILNKLSNSNFDELAKELISLDINKHTSLVKMAESIFNKAIIEPKFSIMYAKLAKNLAGYYIEENGKTYHFRELLIDRCQMMFNECVSFDPALENKMLVTKETSIGCMTFIGELYNCDLLTNKIINSCFLLLLMKSEQNKFYIIDCICALMKVVGKNFSTKCKNETQIIFDKLQNLIKLNILSNKDKFSLMDLVDLKNSNKW